MLVVDDEEGQGLTAGGPALIKASRSGTTGPGVLKASNSGLEASPAPGWGGSRSRGSLDFWMPSMMVRFVRFSLLSLLLSGSSGNVQQDEARCRTVVSGQRSWNRFCQTLAVAGFAVCDYRSERASKEIGEFREIHPGHLPLYILITQMDSGSSGVALIWNPAVSGSHRHDDDAEI